MISLRKIKRSKPKQQGIVLITSLIFILAITIIGFAGLEVSSMQERMAGNFRNKQMAFQGAEAALRAAEDYLANTPSLPPFDGTNGLYTRQTNGAQRLATINWDASTQVVELTGGFSELSTIPKYFIETYELDNDNDSLAANNAIDQFHYYRITARAKGQSQAAEVILQSIYRL